MISAVDVYWLAFEHYDVIYKAPESWKLLYKDGNTWKEVTNPSGYEVEADRYNRTSFDAVTTTELKLVAQLQQGFSGGIIEWKVY